MKTQQTRFLQSLFSLKTKDNATMELHMNLLFKNPAHSGYIRILICVNLIVHAFSILFYWDYKHVAQ